MNYGALAYEVLVYAGTFVFAYLTGMVAAHGWQHFVVDYACLTAALGTLGIFHVGSQRQPSQIVKPN